MNDNDESIDLSDTDNRHHELQEGETCIACEVQNAIGVLAMLDTDFWKSDHTHNDEEEHEHQHEFFTPAQFVVGEVQNLFDGLSYLNGISKAQQALGRIAETITELVAKAEQSEAEDNE